MDLKNELKQYIEDNLITFKLDFNIFRKLKSIYMVEDEYCEEEYYYLPISVTQRDGGILNRF